MPDRLHVAEGDTNVCKAMPESQVGCRFETEAAARAEDLTRARRIGRVVNRPGPTNWTNICDRLWLAKQRSPRVVAPALDRNALRSLAGRLKTGAVSHIAPASLASSLRMRAVRRALIQALLDAFAEFADDDLRTVTVVYAGWRYTPATLDGVTAARLKAQFIQHLNRARATKVAGPLFAVLHGEYEPSSGCFQLHYHVLTTREKAAALKTGLKAANMRGYRATATGAAPVHRSRIGNRVDQFSYLAKGFWPSRPVVLIRGKLRRVRDPRRIPEPYSTQVLLWLDRQKFGDLVVTNGCWSKWKGGTAAMKRLYCTVLRASRL